MPLPMSLTHATLLATLLAGCSSSGDKSEVGSATRPAGSAAPSPPLDASAEPTAATVIGPTKSATGSLELGGAITGTFEWKKKDQRNPITCVWDPAKEIGTVRVDVSDGAGKLVTLGVDVPPTDAGLPRLDVSSKALTAPLKTQLGFNVSGEDTTLVIVKFDAKLGEDETKPDLTIKGTLEVSCPKR
ncbi:MAG: hypothetical protein ACKV2T_27255 [Kofleriaceae bacterium]